ncbi:RNA-binding S4 domain-containing protein [Thermincola ferriacetica]|uniref:RNA-binding S4 domain protein n=2 Tax=Thermincola TaxID=278993 RepID=D5X8C0_THEPJ|nr:MULTISPECIES: RNA-binding S4 domain-containing protein [Thermincola]ADG80899.1 RNA-binding S4 domain protein [Thermincola potens JR]KNZ68497.1 RNA-binding S4 domain-containing protein [Thermincola ferriacetica]
MQVKNIFIETETIKLDQFLKWATIVSTGGEAKNMIAGGSIKVNGEIELRRGRQLRHEDIVEVTGFGTFKVVTLR